MTLFFSDTRNSSASTCTRFRGVITHACDRCSPCPNENQYIICIAVRPTDRTRAILCFYAYGRRDGGGTRNFSRWPLAACHRIRLSRLENNSSTTRRVRYWCAAALTIKIIIRRRRRRVDRRKKKRASDRIRGRAAVGPGFKRFLKKMPTSPKRHAAVDRHSVP